MRYANGSKQRLSAFSVSTSCATHHLPGSSLYAPYNPLSPLAVGKVMNKARGMRPSPALRSEAGGGLMKRLTAGTFVAPMLPLRHLAVA